MGNDTLIDQTHSAADAGADKQDRYAIIISGDGLRTTLAKQLAHRLATKGISTGRVRAIAYFWSSRSAKEMSNDLARQLLKRAKRFPKERFTLVGYSFGAGTLPFAVNRLPEHLKARVDGVALLAPPASADFEFFFRSWIHMPTKHAQDVVPEIERLSQTLPVLYMRGENDYVGPSDDLETGINLTLMSLPGGHDFNRDYDVLVDNILTAFP